jgi:hypothetical protein
MCLYIIAEKLCAYFVLSALYNYYSELKLTFRKSEKKKL